MALLPSSSGKEAIFSSLAERTAQEGGGTSSIFSSIQSSTASATEFATLRRIMIQMASHQQSLRKEENTKT
eukprot:14868918-Ditylum_brightwellii.AAC.1